MATWPLLPENEGDYPYFADEAFESTVEELAETEDCHGLAERSGTQSYRTNHDC